MNKRTTKILIIAFLTTIGLTFGYVKIDKFLKVDSCLDHSGRWNYETNECDTADFIVTPLKVAYIGYNPDGTLRTDSLNFDRLKRANPSDTLLASTQFTLQGREHIINIRTNDLVAPTDGGSVYIELKDLGVIYYRSTSSYSYRRLKTNNDSINYIIDTAIDNVILNFTLGCYEPVTE